MYAHKGTSHTVVDEPMPGSIPRQVAVAAVGTPAGYLNCLVGVDVRSGGVKWEVPTGHDPAGSLSAIHVRGRAPPRPAPLSTRAQRLLMGELLLSQLCLCVASLCGSLVLPTVPSGCLIVFEKPSDRG